MKPGQRILCIRATHSYGMLRKNKVYTVRAVDPTFNSIEIAEYPWKTNYKPERFVPCQKPAFVKL